jgi:hypothetical protein
MAASEGISKVLMVLLGDVYRKLSAMHRMYATYYFTNAHSKREEYWQGKRDTLMLIKACHLDMSSNIVPVASIDELKPGITPGWRTHISAKASIVRLETSLNRDGTFNVPVGAAY